MANPVEYIVFEPDQVLTNEHLNETFNYLDQQNRWTRNKLIGIGIVCGLDIALTANAIQISKGCGITSQGYLITLDTTPYTWYIPYSAPDAPINPLFDFTGDLPFYAPFCKNKKVWALITDVQYDELEDGQKLQAAAISSAANFLKDYAVVLFLEAAETSLKNCNMLDCNNAGSTMDFTVRPLLVAIKDLSKAGNSGGNVDVSLPHQVNLKRYNVPYADLNTADDVLNAFTDLVDDTTLTAISNAYNYAYEKYGSLLNVNTNPFTDLLANLKKYRNVILTNNPLFIQYFYDLIDDMLKAWYEFSVKMSAIIGDCCPDENLFPLHLVLGRASAATDAFSQNAYRSYFMYSNLFSQMGGEASGAILFFNRMVIMVNKFIVQSHATQTEAPLKITPSQYGLPWLSERAIPYYYQVNAPGAELYKYWSYYKTSHGSAAFNLGYNANLYNTNTAVTQPLLYDIEHYNFFRIEGHIGKSYKKALPDLLSKRANYNLPFDVVAVPAELLSTGATLPQCSMNDLDTDFKLIAGEAACKIHLIFCFLTKLPYQLAYSRARTKADSALYEEQRVKPLKYSAFKLKAEKAAPGVTHAGGAYRKGDYMRQYCPAEADTIGEAYLHALSGSGVFTNPVVVNSHNPLTSVYYYLFQFVDAVENLMYALQTDTVATLDMTNFHAVYQAYLFDTMLTMVFLTELTVAGNKDASGAVTTKTVSLAVDVELDLLVDESGILTNMCIEERLQVLKDEYNARLLQYQQQLSFLNYFKKHPGLEHKAGVPKGGTFVMVYHTAPADTTVTRATDEFSIEGVKILTDKTATEKATGRSLEELDDRSRRMITNFVNECKDAPAKSKREIIGLLGRALQKQVNPTYSIPDGTVIADFYIPYLCCSDCPPVAYVITETVKHKTPVIKMKTKFCDNDKEPAKIEPSIPGGTFNDVPGLDPVKLTFTPRAAGAGKYHIVYTVDGAASEPVEVNVLATPASDFTFENVDNKNEGNLFILHVKFTATDQDDSFTYKWTFPDEFQKKDASGPVQDFSIKFDPESGDVRTEVSLMVSNGDCSTGKPVVKEIMISANGIFDFSAFNSGSLKKGIGKLFAKKKKG